jgi:hypothetical protein
VRKISVFAPLVLIALVAGAGSETALGTPPENNVEMQTESTASRANIPVESRTLSVRINRPFAAVYEFLVNPANWNQWAFGLGKSLRQSNGGWIADSDGGIVKVRFTPRNDFGVVDHTVIRPAGAQIYVPMRLIRNGTGCELLFTLFREPGMTDERYNSDTTFVQRDLNGLKELLEK